MAEFTPNYNLEKPTKDEKYYIQKFNQNFQKVDDALKGHDDTIAENKSKEEQDIADTKEYADNAVAEHNMSDGENVHPYLQTKITEAADKALADAKEYAYSKAETNEQIARHNSDESAHQDIRNLINGMGTTVQTDIENAIAVHNASPESHPDIRTDYVSYTDNAVSTHNNDPEAHGGKDVVYTKLAAIGDGFTSSMTYQDILTAFQDGKNVVALLNSGGEVQLETDGANITGKRTVIEGDKMVLETYVLNPETNMFTKTSTKYLLDYAPAIADEAIADVSIIVDPESDMGGADWNAKEGEDGYIANKPFYEIDNVETVVWEGDINYFYDPDDGAYPSYPGGEDGRPYLQEGVTYTVTIDGDSAEFTVPASNVSSKSNTFSIINTIQSDDGYSMDIAIGNPTSDTSHFKITSNSNVVKKIDSKFTENSFVIDVDLATDDENPTISTNAKDIINAIDNHLPIYIHHDTDIYPIDYCFYRSFDAANKEVGIYFTDVREIPYYIGAEVYGEETSASIFKQPTYNKQTYWCWKGNGRIVLCSSNDNCDFAGGEVSNLYWIVNNTTLVYEHEIYTLVSVNYKDSSKKQKVYTYRHESYSSKVNNVLPLTIKELTVTVMGDGSTAVEGTDYTVEYTSTINGIQTVPMVTFMTYDGSSVIGTSTVTNGVPGSIPTAPERTGGTDYTYVHVGWGTEANATNTVPLENITDSMTVYAVYRQKFNDETIVDTWDEIINSTTDGSYKTKYKLGDTKVAQIGDYNLIMQLVGFDTDDRADGSGKVQTTWISKNVMNSPRAMDSSQGRPYGNTTLRTFLNERFYLPDNIRNNIVPVIKYQQAYENNKRVEKSTTESIWIPSYGEIFGLGSYETQGPSYSNIFDSSTSRSKKAWSTDTKFKQWWLRTTNNGISFKTVTPTGELSYAQYDDKYYLCIGFCLGENVGTISDDWSTIAASAKDGSYKTKYSIGDTRFVDLGTEGKHLMELVAFDADDKADGTGKAPMTWIMKDLLNTTHRMNPDKVDGQEGTGSLGGYDKTEMKSYLTETILPLFPADIRNNIVPVTKHQKAYDVSGTASQESTTETLWIPGDKEIFNRTTYDTDGSSYSDVFKDATSRKKKRNSSFYSWWLRSAGDTTSGFKNVTFDGSNYGSNAKYADGVCPGFCM